jgi:alpha-beta hydrolase superfamily lysophospholipase
MQHETFWLDASDGTKLFVNRWFGHKAPKAILMISHGMAEHGARYARLAHALVPEGFEVIVHDIRGHGKTAENGALGHYADQDGWNKVVGDLTSVNQYIRKKHPKTPIILLAHSMGSYIGQAWLMQCSEHIQGAILSASNYAPMSRYRQAKVFARFESWRQGPRGYSALLEHLSFGAFNKAFKPARTPADWLSRDSAEVDKYINDPLCGFRCSNQLWLDLLDGLQFITAHKNLKKINSNLPLLIIGGAHDPAIKGDGINKLAKALSKAGAKRVQTKIYPQARHELLNETNRDEVIRFYIEWLKQF